MNPNDLLDSLLEDYASPKARRLIHALIAVTMVVVTAFLAAGGNWKEAALSLLALAYAALNKANTQPDGIPSPEMRLRGRMSDEDLATLRETYPDSTV